jgi:hypothetical protein
MRHQGQGPNEIEWGHAPGELAAIYPPQIVNRHSVRGGSWIALMVDIIFAAASAELQSAGSRLNASRPAPDCVF